MRTEVIKAGSIAEAAERILDELKEDDIANTTESISSRNNNVIYFDGWDGLGASAVLRAVARRLTAMASSEAAPAGLQFDQIIHVDCSKWESKRSLQRAVAEQLELPASVMEMFDSQDEEDDFNGIPEGSRNEIQQVLKVMFQRIKELNRRFLVIFHNGSPEEIDLAMFGFLLFGYYTNKVLWTFQGKFRLYPMMKVQGGMKSTGKTDVFLSAASPRHDEDGHEFWSSLLREEAAEVVASLDKSKTGCIINHPSKVIQCFSYMSKLCCVGHHFRVDYDLATHCWNYVVCDGIITKQQQLQQGEEEEGVDGDNDGPWQAARALQREMRLDVDHHYHQGHQSLPSHLVRCMAASMDSVPHWNSPLYGVLLALSGDAFQVFGKLGVLKLSRCNLSLSSSPPFLYNPSMKFLWIDHCYVDIVSSKGGELMKEDIRQCFQRLWVLDVRYTSCDQILSAEMVDLMTQLRELNVVGAQDWDISQVQGRLPNIRKLRVTKSLVRCSGHHSKQDLFPGMNKMELLDFSGNSTKQGDTEFSEISTTSHCLETVVITDGCFGIRKVSFRGCAKLKNVLLSGLFQDLRTLDLSGTAVKTLDLSAMTAHGLDELFLDDCQELCAILWPPKDKMKSYLEKVHIDTTWPAASSSSSTPMKENSTEGTSSSSSSSSLTASVTTSASSASLSVAHGGTEPSAFAWCMRVRKARLLRSLAPFKKYFDDEVMVHVEIYSPATAFSSGNDNKAAISNSSMKQQHVLVKVDKPRDSFVYADVEPNKGDAPMLTQIWPCPMIPPVDTLTCYTHVPDHQLNTKSLPGGEQTMTSIVIPDMICNNAFVLHVHDSLSISSAPGPAPALGSTWFHLTWCRVERCPNLEHVFNTQLQERAGVAVVFKWLQILWASELPKAHYIWNWAPPPMFQFGQQSFKNLEFLHVDLCPRLIHVLALPMEMAYNSLGSLETIQIVWCRDLREVFLPLNTTDAKNEQRPQQSTTATVHFQHLKRIHLHELPKLQGICGRWRISAPELETVNIRGCWSLKRLPAIGDYKSKKVECDCEKEWWDTLEWDGLGANHHPSLYKVTHSRYYKKTLLKSSVLR